MQHTTNSTFILVILFALCIVYSEEREKNVESRDSSLFDGKCLWPTACIPSKILIRDFLSLFLSSLVRHWIECAMHSRSLAYMARERAGIGGEKKVVLVWLAKEFRKLFAKECFVYARRKSTTSEWVNLNMKTKKIGEKWRWKVETTTTTSSRTWNLWFITIIYCERKCVASPADTGAQLFRLEHRKLTNSSNEKWKTRVSAEILFTSTIQLKCRPRTTKSDPDDDKNVPERTVWYGKNCIHVTTSRLRFTQKTRSSLQFTVLSVVRCCCLILLCLRLNWLADDEKPHQIERAVVSQRRVSK